jgi:membrane protein insertase Oxa1/YidC/SpoIIIJ/rhodanese-related sulfurtransferase/phosphohistidine swiveling domain-containing protein
MQLSYRPTSPRSRTGLLGRLVGSTVGLCALSTAAWAIPSPDVMVNLFASSAQILGLVSVVLGRWLWVRKKHGSRVATQRGSRAVLYAAIGLCALSTIGWGLYAAHVADLRNTRLQVNLNRNSREEGRKIVDVSLRELSFSKQLELEDGLTTEEFERRLKAGEAGRVLDVREDEEYEVGGIEGAVHLRFPDVLAGSDRFVERGALVTLLCFNGNRSSELAGELRRRGCDAHFLIGGYEKWISEARPIAFNLERERRDLREISDYPNKDELLDTPDVHRLLAARDVLFVDVRYPGEFETLGHLPGAVNIPFRKLTTPELDAAIAALPKERPIVVPCYDKRSSFFGLVIGLRLSRLGYEYLGRYTVPEGFAGAAAGSEKAHVAAWKSAQEDKTFLSVIAAPLGGALAWCRTHAGSLAAAILLLVLLVRLAVSPLTIRAERDRRAELALRPQVDAIKARFRDDPAARSRATMALLSRNGIKPAWNLASSVVQLALFTAFFSVVSSASRGSTETFAWVPRIGRPDPTWILPLVSATAMALLVWTSAARRTWKRAVGALIAAGVLLALVAPLTAGTQLYLAANLVLLHVHNLLVGFGLDWRARAPARRRESIQERFGTATVVPLRHAHAVEGCGAKAARLGRMLEAGLPVPGGFVVRASAVAHARLGADARAAVLSAHARLGAARVAVRSSGLNEDGADKSYAGVFESILDVEASGLERAIEDVARSWAGARVDAYSDCEAETGGIVVQSMVPAAWAGVLFTEHPGESGTCAVEMIEGLGDDLVSGRKQPHAYRLGRASGQVLGGDPPPIDLAPLFALARRVETLFEAPQDIEWAWVDGRFLLLQARDITRFSRLGADERALRERERHRLLAILGGTPADEAVLVQNELSELLPEPTPLSLSLMEALWDHDGAAHRACGQLGIPYEVSVESKPYLVTAFGKLFVDEREASRRVSRGPSALTAFRLARAAEEMEESWREEHLPAALRAARWDAALDLERLDLAEAVALFRDRARRFVTEDYARAEEINVGADLYSKTAVRELERRGLDPADQLSHLSTTVVQEAAQLLGRLGRGEIGEAEFLAHSGHRAPHDWELAAPRYSEDEELVAAMAESSIGTHARAPRPRRPIGKRVLDLAVDRALRWQALKEDAKHLALREVAFLRRLVLSIGERIGIGEQVFLLRIDEVGRLDDANWRAGRALEILQARADERDALACVHLPARLCAATLEELDLQSPGAIARPASNGALHGTRVSGTAGVIGRARVLRSAEASDSFQDGEILVARFTDPTWMPLFPRARAIVTEVGGWLSHAAIQAREYGLPAVVGVRGALDAIQTGELVRLAPDGSVEVLQERRREARTPVVLQVVVRRAHGDLPGRIDDVSTSGALLGISGTKLDLGERVTLAIDGGPEHPATVVRNGIPGIYGLHLAAPIPELARAS